MSNVKLCCFSHNVEILQTRPNFGGEQAGSYKPAVPESGQILNAAELIWIKFIFNVFWNTLHQNCYNFVCIINQ